MKARIIVAVVGIPALIAVLFFLPLWCFAIVIAGFTGIGASEFMRCTADGAPKYLIVITVIFAVLAPLLSWLSGDSSYMIALSFLFVIILASLTVFSMGKNRVRISLAQILSAFFAGAIFPNMLSALVRLGYVNQGLFYGAALDIIKPLSLVYIFLPIVIAFSCDIGAYFIGVFLGKHKLAPTVSPKKTVEGSVGGIVCGVGFALLYGFILSRTYFAVNFLALAVYGLVGSLLCELGDLFFSAVKRQFGVKDYGTLLPGHGGALDRLDGMCFVAPAMELLLILYPAITPAGFIW